MKNKPMILCEYCKDNVPMDLQFDCDYGQDCPTCGPSHEGEVIVSCSVCGHDLYLIKGRTWSKKDEIEYEEMK